MQILTRVVGREAALLVRRTVIRTKTKKGKFGARAQPEVEKILRHGWIYPKREVPVSRDDAGHGHNTGAGRKSACASPHQALRPTQMMRNGLKCFEASANIGEPTRRPTCAVKGRGKRTQETTKVFSPKA